MLLKKLRWHETTLLIFQQSLFISALFPLALQYAKVLPNHAFWIRFPFWGSGTKFYAVLQKSLQMVIAAMKLKDAYSLEEKLWPI